MHSVLRNLGLLLCLTLSAHATALVIDDGYSIKTVSLSSRAELDNSFKSGLLTSQEYQSLDRYVRAHGHFQKWDILWWPQTLLNYALYSGVSGIIGSVVLTKVAQEFARFAVRDLSQSQEGRRRIAAFAQLLQARPVVITLNQLRNFIFAPDADARNLDAPVDPDIVNAITKYFVDAGRESGGALGSLVGSLLWVRSLATTASETPLCARFLYDNGGMTEQIPCDKPTMRSTSEL